MLNGQRVNGVTTVVFQRSLDAQERFDQVIPPVGRVNVIAAIGPLNSRKEANYHGSERTGTQGAINYRTKYSVVPFLSIFYLYNLTEDHRIDFTSRGVNQCPTLLAPIDKTGDKTERPGSGSSSVPTTTENMIQPWKPNIISGEKVLTARIGPTGGKKGYSAITGKLTFIL